MELNNDLITQFAKITKFNNKDTSATTVRGTVRTSGDRNYIQLDGADDDSKTPVETTVEISDGDRVIAAVKDHRVIVTGNKTNPAVGVKTADGLRSSITQTADEIRAEVANEVSGLNSTITQTASDIRSEVADEVNGLNSTITQTANEIRSEVKGVDDKYSEVKQTVDGLTITTSNGKTVIDGGNIDAANLNLTGAISWGDLDSNTQNAIDDGAYDLAKDAYDLAGEAWDLASNSNATVPDYIKETYIDETTIQSPTIIGGRLYAVGSDPEYTSTFSVMDEDGFYIYHSAATTDSDNDTERLIPKMSLIANDSGNTIRLVLGSGEDADNKWYNRFYISKEANRVDMQYVFGYDGEGVGFTMMKDSDELTIHGVIGGTTGVFPIGYIYLSYDDSISPASLFGGSWTRISGYFLYAGGSSATMGDTGSVVTSGGTGSASYIKIAAWRRVS